MNNLAIPVMIGLFALLLLNEQANAAAPAASLVDLQGLAANFVITPDQENRINELYTAMQPYNLTPMQQDFMLAQMLYESGLLTSQANYNLMDNNNNYAGLTTTQDGYAQYASINDFMSAYIGFLTKGANPLGAQSLADFNNRLQQNGYYTENPQVYYSGIAAYYNLLAQ